MRVALIAALILLTSACVSHNEAIKARSLGVAQLLRESAEKNGSVVDVVGRFEFSPDTSALWDLGGDAAVALELPRTIAQMYDLQKKNGQTIRVIGRLNANWCSHACLDHGRIEDLRMAEVLGK